METNKGSERKEVNNEERKGVKKEEKRRWKERR